MKRRSFLALLGLSPVAAVNTPTVAAEGIGPGPRAKDMALLRDVVAGQRAFTNVLLKASIRNTYKSQPAVRQ